MKTAVILLGLIVALAAADENCPLLLELKRGFEVCKESMNPSEETLQHVAGETGADNRDVQCFQACMMTKAGLLEDHKFNIEKMETLLRSAENPNDEVITKLVDVMTKCKDESEKSDDDCEIAGNYAKCTINIRSD